MFGYPRLDPGRATFSVTAPAGGTSLVCASLPFMPGEFDESRCWQCAGAGGLCAAQWRVLSRHRDASARHVMFRFLCEFPAPGEAEFEALPGGELPPSMIRAREQERIVLAAGPREVELNGKQVVVRRAGQQELLIEPDVPDFEVRFLGPDLEVVEEGPWFTWVRAKYFGGRWNCMLELKADALGGLTMIVRHLRTLSDGLFPAFGVSTVVDGDTRLCPWQADGRRMPLWQGGTARREFEIASAEAPRLVVLDGAHVRQGVVVREERAGKTRFRFLRDPALDAGPRKVFREGQERSFKLRLVPPGQQEAAGEEEGELRAVASARRRAVVTTGSHPTHWGELSAIRKLVTEQVLLLQCRDGDDYGDVTGAVRLADPVYAPSSLTRLDTGLEAMLDYYHGGDIRLREFGLRWAENYVDLHLCRGWDQNAFGGERYAVSYERMMPSFNQKGFSLLLLSYAETGDPRYLEAATAALDRVVRHLDVAAFVGTYFLDAGWLLDANVRPGYLCKDLVECFRFTGDERYLRAARKIARYLAKLLGGTFWKEGYYDPYSPLELAVEGEGKAVHEDCASFPKPFILQYNLLGMQELYGEEHSDWVRRLLMGLSDWFVAAQQYGAFWSYPQVRSVFTASVQMAALGCLGLLRSYRLLGREQYRDAAVRSLGALACLLRRYGCLPSAGPVVNLRPFYPEDCPPWQHRLLSLDLSSATRDALCCFLACVNEYLSQGLPLSALAEAERLPAVRYLLDEAPVSPLEGTAVPAQFAARRSEVAERLAAAWRALEKGDRQDALAALNSLVERYPDFYLASLRVAELHAEDGDWEKAQRAYERCLARFPDHPRAGALRLRLAAHELRQGRSSEAVALLRETVRQHAGSVWERNAQAWLWLAGAEPEPPQACLVLGSGQAATLDQFVLYRTGGPAETSTSLEVRRAGDVLRLEIECGAAPPTDSPDLCEEPVVRDYLDMGYRTDEQVRVYLDVRNEYEQWVCAAVDPSGRRAFREPGWALDVKTVLDDQGWSAESSASAEGWRASVVLPLSRLGLQEHDLPRVVGINAMRLARDVISFWRPMVLLPVLPHRFGLLALR